MINGRDLSILDVWRVARGQPGAPRVAVAPDAQERVRASRRVIERVILQGEAVYGVNTGFGQLSNISIAPADIAQLQRNLLRSHACAVGEPFPVDVVRAMMLLRANALVKGHSGVRMETVELLVDCLNSGITPRIPSQGSLGASGDLAPLAHLGLVLMGEGEVIKDGAVYPADAALRERGLAPIVLAPKEGLALINGTQAMTAVGALCVTRARFLSHAADGVAAMTFEALRGVRDAFDGSLHELRPHPGQIAAAASMRAWLDGSGLTTAQGELRVQDAYSLRCIPQVHGATRDALDYTARVLDIEQNAATDNPLVLPDSERIVSGGHFHGQPVALALDFLKLAVAELASIAERRVERLVNPHLSGLPAFLARDPGLSSGLMIIQYVAASLVSENKVLAHPASVDSIPSSAGQEDHVSMGTTAARQAAAIVENVARVLAIEAIAAAEAISQQAFADRMAPRTAGLFARVRRLSPEVVEDRSLSADIETVAQAILCGEWYE